MRSHATLNRLCALTAILSMALAYILAGYWLIVLIAPGMALFWFVLKKWSGSRAASSLLFVFVLLAAVGVTLDVSIVLLLIACTAALACWDLTHFADSLVKGQPLHTTVPLENHHLRSLALAISVGLSLSLMSTYMRLQLPFWLTVCLVLIATSGLVYGLRSTKSGS